VRRHRADDDASAEATALMTPGALVMAVTGLGGFLVSLDVSIANTLLTPIGRELGVADRAALSWIITGYAIAFAAVLVPAGRVADRIGRRRSCLAGLLVFAAGSVLCGIAPNLWVVLVGRVVQGFGAATVAPASLGLLLSVTGTRLRAVYTARWIGAAALGMCLGSIVGGLLTDAGSWRWAFLANLPVVLLVLIASPRLPETPRQPGSSLPDPVGAVLLAAAAASLTLGISEATAWGVTSVRTTAALAAGIGLGALFVRRSGRVADPLLDLALLGRRRVALATATTVLYAAAFFGMLFTHVLFLVGWWHLSLVQAGLVIVPMGTVVVLMTTRIGGLAAVTGYRLPLVLGSGLMGAGLLLGSALAVGQHWAWVWLVPIVLTGLGIGLCYPLLGAAAVEGLPGSALGAASAVNQCARQMGAALGVAVSVAALGVAEPVPLARFQAAWLVAACFCAAAAITSAFMPGRGPAVVRQVDALAAVTAGSRPASPHRQRQSSHSGSM
jgi:EmrB/QacA subfamily drug resistance transporter